jgi:CBS domain-containing protein
MKKIREMLRTNPNHQVYTVIPEQSVLSAAQYMRAANIGAVPVLRNDVLLGVVSERDMLTKVLGPGLDPRDVFVGQIMSDQVITVSPDETWEDCMIKMRTTHCRHLPVVENHKVIGMISLREVLGATEAETLDAYLWDRTVRQEINEAEVRK